MKQCFNFVEEKWKIEKNYINWALVPYVEVTNVGRKCAFSCPFTWRKHEVNSDTRGVTSRALLVCALTRRKHRRFSNVIKRSYLFYFGQAFFVLVSVIKSYIEASQCFNSLGTWNAKQATQSEIPCSKVSRNGCALLMCDDIFLDEIHFRAKDLTDEHMSGFCGPHNLWGWSYLAQYAFLSVFESRCRQL